MKRSRKRKKKREKPSARREHVLPLEPAPVAGSPLVLDLFGGAGPELTIRRVIETVPGERALQPSFGCAVHRLERVLDASERAVAAALIEESLERWVPWLGVSRVEVLGVRAFDDDDPDAPRGTLRLRFATRSGSGEVDVAWYGLKSANASSLEDVR